MKFKGGYWLDRPEAECTNAVRLREIRNEGDRIYIFRTVQSGFTRYGRSFD
ncbi:MAG: hypothetical protein MJ177_03755 [Clostridia bacterium]|nr:hypothetical protein [Clostridia bacterium]